jgi:voltage-gated potassium channel
MTFITISTLGYGEIHPLDTTGRFFTIVIATIGIASLFYIFTITMENLVTIQISNYRGRKKMKKEIENLKDHIILIGYGRVGQLAAKELLNHNEKFIVIDNDFIEDDILNQSDRILKLMGDASEDETLLKAGIESARGVIVTTANSATTLYVTLSARVLNPKAHIIVRADDYSSIEKLKRAGADEVVNPYSIGGQRLVNMMLHPSVVNFLELNFSSKNNFMIEQINLPLNCYWVGKTIGDLDLRKNTGATILAVIREDNPIINPDSKVILIEKDELIAFGTLDSLKKLEDLMLK